jgi:hypothetical protein
MTAREPLIAAVWRETPISPVVAAAGLLKEEPVQNAYFTAEGPVAVEVKFPSGFDSQLSMMFPAESAERCRSVSKDASSVSCVIGPQVREFGLKAA